MMAKGNVQTDFVSEVTEVSENGEKKPRNRDKTLMGTRGDINKEVATQFAGREARNPSIEHNVMVEAAYRWFLELTDVETIKRLIKEVKDNRVKASEDNISV